MGPEQPALVVSHLLDLYVHYSQQRIHLLLKDAQIGSEFFAILIGDSYIEQATGRTQWDPPSNLPPGPYAPPGPNAPYVAGAGHDERGLFGNTHGHSGHDYNTAPGAPADPNKSEKEKKDKGHSTAMLAAAGIGGIAAGAWIGHELSMLIAWSSKIAMLTRPS